MSDSRLFASITVNNHYPESSPGDGYRRPRCQHVFGEGTMHGEVTTRDTPVRTVLAVLFGVMICGAGASAADVAPPEIEVRGEVFVIPVDGRRFIVAVDTQAKGMATDIFLVVLYPPPGKGGKRHGRGRFTPAMRSAAEVQYIAGERLAVTPSSGLSGLDFLVTGDDGGESQSVSAIRFRNTADLAYYTPPIAIPIKDLNALRKAVNCDAAPHECVRVGGQWLPFPG